MFLHVPTVDEDVVVDGDAALDSCEGLADLVVEYARAVGGPKDQPLHPVQSLVGLEDTVGAVVEGNLVEPIPHV